MENTNTKKQFVDYKGLSTYDRLLKQYLEKTYPITNNYAEDSDVEDIFEDEIDSSENNKIVQVKTLSKYNEILKSKLNYFVKENKAIVKIGEDEVELSTKDYVDSKFKWGYSL